MSVYASICMYFRVKYMHIHQVRGGHERLSRVLQHINLQAAVHSVNVYCRKCKGWSETVAYTTRDHSTNFF